MLSTGSSVTTQDPLELEPPGAPSLDPKLNAEGLEGQNPKERRKPGSLRVVRIDVVDKSRLAHLAHGKVALKAMIVGRLRMMAHGAGHSKAPATMTSSPAAFSDSDAART
jgi:hypothetical protein